ncbi:sigma-70 family RNA polymerase sigma factor [Streptomyces fulvoviolaceus]|uniref:sigma-70 family RNA polymerase sigma factor n=1 Tax=Streptomyces fulvoviolaceus TaxID=285535 RepID=UPI0004C68E03|nr:sigma-70 family RNA polymerase sigma factor [Streptomyces fulvoviolaceus]
MITSALPASTDSRTKRESADASATAWALAARTGDPAAVDHFVRALHRDVLRYVSHLCADPQAVDDLAQDTFLRALGSLHLFEGRCSARVWLLSIARRAVIDAFRHAAARPRLYDAPDWQLVVERAQPQDLPGFDDGVALLDLLAALPAERREAFVLTQLLGLPYEEAAAVSDCPVGTVRSRVARARATLIALVTDGGTSHALEAVGEDRPAALAA